MDVIILRKRKERIIVCEIGAEAEEICEHRASNIEVLSIVNLRDMVRVKVKQSHYRLGQVPEGSRKLRFPDFMTTAQDGGKVVSLTHRPPLPPGNAPGTHFC